MGLFISTRSYAALRAADLDWIVGPGYSLGGYILEKNHEKPTWNHEKTKKYQENHHDCDLTSATPTTAPSLGRDPCQRLHFAVHFLHLCANKNHTIVLKRKKTQNCLKKIIFLALLPPLPLLWDKTLVEDYQAGCKCYFPLRNVSTPMNMYKYFFQT